MFRPRNLALSFAVCAAFTAFAAWLFELKLERAVALAPVIVLSFGAIAGLVVFWGRVFLAHVRGRDEPAQPRRTLDTKS